ncbi:hypothetical protein [Pontibaca methylaminivorans]|uniref:Uncharacterized protein n=1 Tax=Pontibaca methylaminivorans TaxID=515897 RepID=A0A1R3W9D1_9RHOB|nr:hypothetical protein [Pontibaca methylaminivorans]SIT74641.1 hypothetical protein SAMN05421849_0190 [Pontibaca methylaminivorans]
MRGTATFAGGEIHVEFETGLTRVDYGVPRSPVWFEPDSDGPSIASLTILGEAYDPSDLPPRLRRAILALADEVEEWATLEDAA